MNMVVPWSCRFIPSTLQWAPTKKQLITLFFPCFPHSCFFHLACDWIFFFFNFRHVAGVQNSKFYRLPWHWPMLFLPCEGERSLHTSAFCWTPFRKVVAPPCKDSQLMQHRAESFHFDLLFLAAVLPAPRHHLFFLQCWGILRPCCHTWDSAPLHYLSTLCQGHTPL